jgi:hypothetical protein
MYKITRLHSSRSLNTVVVVVVVVAAHIIQYEDSPALVARQHQAIINKHDTEKRNISIDSLG